MPTMQIEQLSIRNFRVFKKVDIVDIPSVAVFVGANGSGKSTLFDVFGFLKDALLNNVHVAVTRRGGLREVRSRDQDGPISIQIKFREPNGPLVTYQLEVSGQDGRAVVSREVL